MSRVAHINVDPPRRTVGSAYTHGLGVGSGIGIGIHSLIRKTSFDDYALRLAKQKQAPTLNRALAHRPSFTNLRDHFSPSTTAVKRPTHHHVPIPISFDLSTPHALLVANSFKLATASGLLAALGADRTIRTSTGNVLDRMPYAAAAAAANGAGTKQMQGRGTNKENGAATALQLNLNGPEKVEQEKREEADVEVLLGIPRKVKQRANVSSIFVHPPTPERQPESVASLSPPTSSPPVGHSPSHSPSSGSRSLPGTITQGMALPLHVLPEVRSPPRRTVAMAADSIQLTTRRGRRPRLFGFTEMGDSSGSSRASSAANSRSNSPERRSLPEIHVSPSAAEGISQVKPLDKSMSTSPGPSPGSAIPRRNTVQRTLSESHLPSITSVARSPANNGPVKPHAAPHAPAPNHTKPSKSNGLKLDFTGIVPVAPVESPSIINGQSPYSAKLIRKKSGEILKPALKYGGPLTTSGTPIGETGPSPRFETKSLPATPSFPKYVHFDAQLERVKLFNKDHKPKVVSRDGSPTQYTTSEGEEYPFPSTDEEGPGNKDAKKVLQIKLPNFPTSHPPDSDLHLESLFLEDDRKSLKGVVVCRNFAFSKWVAIRFTFDWWQTTSEVSATYKDSPKGGEFDRFTFQIKLADLMARIEEKTLFLAVRYNTDGREIWDSNGGGNYQVLFEKVAPTPRTLGPARYTPTIQAGMGKAVGGRKSQWTVSGDGDRMADLREKLNRLKADDDTSVQLSPNRSGAFNWSFGGGSPTGSPRRGSVTLEKDGNVPPAGAGLAARYDFGASLKGARKTSPSMRSVDLPNVRAAVQAGNVGGVSSAGVNMGHPWMSASAPSPQAPPSSQTTFTSETASVPAPPSRYTFPAKPTGATASEPKTVPPPLTVPDVHVQGPSPSPPSSPIASLRPGFSRANTSPAMFPHTLPRCASREDMATPKPIRVSSALPTDNSPLAKLKSLQNDTPSSSVDFSPPSLLRSDGSTETLPDSLSSSVPPSPADLGDGMGIELNMDGDGMDSPSPAGGRPGLPPLSYLTKGAPGVLGDRRDSVSSNSSQGSAGWSPSLSDSDMSAASYSSFIEQFCWGGAAAAPAPPPTAPEPRRVHSTSSLDAYFHPTDVPAFNAHVPGHQHSASFSHSEAFVSQMHGPGAGGNRYSTRDPTHTHAGLGRSPLYNDHSASTSANWSQGSGFSTPRAGRAQSPTTPTSMAAYTGSTVGSGGSVYSDGFFGRADRRDRESATPTAQSPPAGIALPAHHASGNGSSNAARYSGSWEGVDRARLEDAIRRTLENGPSGSTTPMASPPVYGASPDKNGHGLVRHGVLKGLPGNMSPPVRAGV